MDPGDSSRLIADERREENQLFLPARASSLPGRRLPVSLIIKAPRDLLCIASRNLETSNRGRNRLQWSRVRRLALMQRLLHYL